MDGTVIYAGGTCITGGCRGGSGLYAVRTEDRMVDGRRKVTRIWMHREILGLPRDKGKLIVDHVNGKGLDNRRCNLRIISQLKNSINRAPKAKCSSRYKGVSKEEHSPNWRVRLRVGDRRINGGVYPSEKEAARAYDELAIKYHGKYAFLNKVDE